MTIRPSFLFDLDGTLVDSVYEHVLAWQEALTAEGIELSVWRIHRKIGMSGGLMTNILLRESGREYNDPDSRRFNSYLRGRQMIATLFPDADAAFKLFVTK